MLEKQVRTTWTCKKGEFLRKQSMLKTVKSKKFFLKKKKEKKKERKR